MKRTFWILALLVPLLPAAISDYASAKRKLDAIENETLRAGSRVTLTPAELNAYAKHEIDLAAPGAVRNARLTLGSNTATAQAVVDFLKLQRAQGQAPGWVISKLLEGEREVEVAARFHSAHGSARVTLERVTISGVTIDGGVLQFVIDRYVRPLYPEAKIDEPFDLGHQVDRFVVQPGGVDIHIGARKTARALFQ